MLDQDLYIHKLLSHPTHFDPEDGGTMYLQNNSNTVHINTVQRPKSKINITDVNSITLFVIGQNIN
jgi:hypothetical protein